MTGEESREIGGEQTQYLELHLGLGLLAAVFLFLKTRAVQTLSKVPDVRHRTTLKDRREIVSAVRVL